MPKDNPIGAYSTDTNTYYPTWDALLQAEANGFVVVAIIHKDGHKRSPWPYVVGTFSTQREANNAKARLKNQQLKQTELDPRYSVTYWVRPVWKDARELKALR